MGTPFCVTVDFDSLEDGAVTVRERDSMGEERVPLEGLHAYLAERLQGRLTRTRNGCRDPTGSRHPSSLIQGVRRPRSLPETGDLTNVGRSRSDRPVLGRSPDLGRWTRAMLRRAGA